MSKQESVQPIPQNPIQARFNQLSETYKAPLRQSFSQAEETGLNVVNAILKDFVVIENQNKILTGELGRLQKLCEDNGIKHIAESPKPNRAQRRAAEKKKSKK